MAVQITGRQIANSAVDVNKLDLSSGTFDFQSAVLQVATPSADSHAATKGYVDSVSQGLHWKDSVKVATTGNITLSGTQTIDGVAVVADERVLVKNQSTGSENGIYLCKAGAWARAADMNAADEFSGAAVFVQQGTDNGDTGYVCTNDGDVTVGTTAITFVQFTGAGQLSGGDGIDITGSTISVNVDDSSIEISSDALQVKASGITNAMLAGSIANAKLANSSVSFGGVTLALGASDATPAFDLSDATNYPTSSLSGTISNAQLAGSIANEKLANSSVSFGGVTLALGASDATPAFDLSDATNYPASSLSGTISSSQIADSAVSTAKIADDAVTSAKIADSAVDAARLASSAVTTAKIAADAVTNAKIADDAVKTENLDFAGFFAAFDADGSTAGFELAGAVDLEFKEFFVVTVNGLVMEYKDSPDAQDNYKIANDGSGSVGKITFGANLANGDRVTIRGFINN